MEASHTNLLESVKDPEGTRPLFTHFTEVTRVVLVQVGSVVVLTTGHTATTGVLAVLANTTVSGRDMATADFVSTVENRYRDGDTYCFLVLVKRVGILVVRVCLLSLSRSEVG